MIWAVVVLFAVVLLFGFATFRGSPYVPSHKSDVVTAFSELYDLNENDTLFDIGSGDGVVLREAAKKGAMAIGFEINPILVLLSSFISRKNKKISVILADFWLKQFPDDITVVYIFSASRDIKNIIKRVQSEANRLNRSLYLISYGAKLDYMKEVKNIGAHHLYKFNPLHSDKAQV